MTWTAIARRAHGREGLRYSSDMTDREWALAAPFIPPAKTGGRRRTMDMREVLNALLYLASAGCPWRLLPKCFPPVSTVRRYFYAWRDAGLFESINTVLVMNLREIASLVAACVRRRRLRRRQTQGRAHRHGHLDHRDRQTLGHRQRLCASAPPLGCRAHICMAWPMPPAGQGLGNLYRLLNRMLTRRTARYCLA